MWLLRTDCIENKWFNSSEHVPGGYAILSHVWEENEQTFQDTPRLPKSCDETERTQSYPASDKIREFCRVARQDGYQWAWADTCCIDKSSSAELSEAINSMYEYYARARACYVFLVDVRHRDRRSNVFINDDDHWEFYESKWHTRGWTLQELLAPDVVVFLDADWHVIGTKAKLAAVLAEATGISEDVLTLKTELTDVSIAVRMSWASERKTTRVEDEAYCLMGIFGINMPTLYGEGRVAFMRLQEEIMKQSTDTSLFVWGDWESASNSNFSRYQHISHDTASNLLAPAPSAFGEWRSVRFAPNRRPEGMPALLPTFTPSAHGIFCHVPVIKQGSDVVGMLLLCVDQEVTKFMADVILILTECPDVTSPQGPLYDVGGTQGSTNPRAFLVDVSSDGFKSQNFTIEWQHLYIAHRPPSRAPNPHLRLLNHTLFPYLQIPSPVPILCLETQFTLSLSSASGGPMLVLALELTRFYSDSHLALRFGRCAASTARQGLTSGVPWARLSYHSVEVPSASEWNPDDHDCAQDHISDWVQPDLDLDRPRANVPFTTGRFFRFKILDDGGWTEVNQYVKLSFSPSPHDPDLLVLTEVSISGRRPDSIRDAIELLEDGDIFWRRLQFLPGAASTSGAGMAAQSGGVDSPVSTPRAVENATSIRESLAVEGQGDGDNRLDKRGVWSGDKDEQRSREDEETAQDKTRIAQDSTRGHLYSHYTYSRPGLSRSGPSLDNTDHGLRLKSEEIAISVDGHSLVNDQDGDGDFGRDDD